jgi:hypothetical protein
MSLFQTSLRLGRPFWGSGGVALAQMRGPRNICDESGPSTPSIRPATQNGIAMCDICGKVAAAAMRYLPRGG